MPARRVPREKYLTSDELATFEPAIRNAARILHEEARLARIPLGELEQDIRLAVWKYGHNYDRHKGRASTDEKARLQWVARIGNNLIRRQVRSREKTVNISPTLAAPMQEVSGAVDFNSGTYTLLLQLLHARREQLNPAEREALQRWLNGDAKRSIFQEVFATPGKKYTAASLRVMGIGKIRSILTKLIAPHSRKRRR